MSRSGPRRSGSPWTTKVWPSTSRNVAAEGYAAISLMIMQNTGVGDAGAAVPEVRSLAHRLGRLIRLTQQRVGQCCQLALCPRLMIGGGVFFAHPQSILLMSRSLHFSRPSTMRARTMDFFGRDSNTAAAQHCIRRRDSRRVSRRTRRSGLACMDLAASGRLTRDTRSARNFWSSSILLLSRRISPSVSPACRNARRFQTVAVLGDGYSREPRITVGPGRLAAMSSAATPEWEDERRSEPLGRSIPVCPVVRYDVGAPGAVPLRSVSLRPSPAVYRHAQVV